MLHKHDQEHLAQSQTRKLSSWGTWKYNTRARANCSHIELLITDEASCGTFMLGAKLLPISKGTDNESFATRTGCSAAAVMQLSQATKLVTL